MRIIANAAAGKAAIPTRSTAPVSNSTGDKPILWRISMRVRTVLLAACFSAAMTSFSMAQVTGKIKLDGKPPAMKEIDMSGVKDCNALHPDPVLEETVVAKPTGELANVMIWVKT